MLSKSGEQTLMEKRLLKFYNAVLIFEQTPTISLILKNVEFLPQIFPLGNTLISQKM